MVHGSRCNLLNEAPVKLGTRCELAVRAAKRHLPHHTSTDEATQARLSDTPASSTHHVPDIWHMLEHPLSEPCSVLPVTRPATVWPQRWPHPAWRHSPSSMPRPSLCLLCLWRHRYDVSLRMSDSTVRQHFPSVPRVKVHFIPPSCRCQRLCFADHLASWKCPFPTASSHLLASHGSIGISSSACGLLQKVLQLKSLSINKSSSLRLREFPHDRASMCSSLLLIINAWMCSNTFLQSTSSSSSHILPVPIFLGACLSPSIAPHFQLLGGSPHQNHSTSQRILARQHEPITVQHGSCALKCTHNETMIHSHASYRCTSSWLCMPRRLCFYVDSWRYSNQRSARREHDWFPQASTTSSDTTSSYHRPGSHNLQLPALPGCAAMPVLAAQQSARNQSVITGLSDRLSSLRRNTAVRLNFNVASQLCTPP